MANGPNAVLLWKSLFNVRFSPKIEIIFSALQTLKESDPENWHLRNNLGVCYFHQMNVIDSSKEFESSLQSQILSTGVLSPHIIYPVQRNLFTLNEMFKK